MVILYFGLFLYSFFSTQKLKKSYYVSMIKGIGKKVFIVGIGGISLSAIAKFLIKNNHYVAGSDLCYNEMVDSLKNSGIETQTRYG